MNKRYDFAVISVLAALLVAIPSVCYAMMEIELVSKDRAKALGLEVRSNAAGPDTVRVELEIETKGELKSYSRVDLEIHEGGKLLSSSTLREDQSKPGRVLVSFAADRAKLDKLTLRVVVQPSPRTIIGYDLRVKDFVVPALVSAVPQRDTDPNGDPVTAGVQGYVSDVDVYAPPGRAAICSATVSDGKLGAGDQTQVYATDPLLQAALMSAAARQVLVEVQYHPEVVPAPAPADAQSNRVIRVRLLDQPRYLRARAIAMYPPKATRTIDGVKTTFPEQSIAQGATVALAALEACHSADWSGAKPPALADLEKAKTGNHVHFVFDNPMPVEFVGRKIEITELVYSDKFGMLVRSDDDKVYYGTKYTHDKMTAFEKWYRQTLPADVGGGAGAKPQPLKLWAGVSVSSPNTTSNALFTVPQAERLMVGFALVNDGADPVPFERGETELVVNGKPLAGFGDEFREGPIWASLAPGKPYHAALGLGKHFATPGVYKVQWRVKVFESAGLVRGGRVLKSTNVGEFESAVLEFRVVGE